MEKISVIGLDIEDYYGFAIENIDFESPIEINPELFSVQVDSFSYVGKERENEYYIIRIQFEHEKSSKEIDEIGEIHSQIMDIILESCDNNLENEKVISKKILNCLENLL